MRKRSGGIQHNPERLAAVARYVAQDVPAEVACVELGMSRATYYRCKRRLAKLCRTEPARG